MLNQKHHTNRQNQIYNLLHICGVLILFLFFQPLVCGVTARLMVYLVFDFYFYSLKFSFLQVGGLTTSYTEYVIHNLYYIRLRSFVKPHPQARRVRPALDMVLHVLLASSLVHCIFCHAYLRRLHISRE